MRTNKNNIREIIKEKTERPTSVFSGENTYTTLFLLPAYDIFMQPEWYKYFINGYIEDRGLRHCFKRPLFILIKYEKKSEEVKSLFSYLRSKKKMVYSYLMGMEDGFYLKVLVFECPDKYKSDYDLFLKGKYSKFSEEYKAKFNRTISSISGITVESPLYGVIYKTPVLKKKVERFLGESLSKEQEYFGLLSDFEILRNFKTK